MLFAQALERGPAQTSASPDDQPGPSGTSEQGVGESDNMEVRGGRFSKSAEERQKMLKQRKEELLQQARRFVHICLMNLSTQITEDSHLFGCSLSQMATTKCDFYHLFSSTLVSELRGKNCDCAIVIGSGCLLLLLLFFFTFLVLYSQKVCT